jgi:hypothetical protein
MVRYVEIDGTVHYVEIDGWSRVDKYIIYGRNKRLLADKPEFRKQDVDMAQK